MQNEQTTEVSTNGVDLGNLVIGKSYEFPETIEAKSFRAYASPINTENEEKKRIFKNGTYLGLSENNEHKFIGHKIACTGRKNKKKYHFYVS